MTTLPAEPPSERHASPPQASVAWASLAVPALQGKVLLAVDACEPLQWTGQEHVLAPAHWRSLVKHAQDVVLPHGNGRLLKKQLGGLLAEFDHPAQAVQAAFRLHDHLDKINSKLPASRHSHLRVGIDTSNTRTDGNDLYSQGVHLAARMAMLAAPGETLVTDSVFDGIVPGLDAQAEDRGHNYLKHWPQPVRTWCLQALHRTSREVRSDPVNAPAAAPDPSPAVAVLPFETLASDTELFMLGELIADGVIARLHGCEALRVVSRLSTTAFRGRQLGARDVGLHLRASHTLHGSCAVQHGQVVITAKLTGPDGEAMWADRLTGPVTDLLAADSTLLSTLADACARATRQARLPQAAHTGLPLLDSQSMLLAGVGLLHRSSAKAHQHGKRLLDAVAERHPQAAAPWAWLAKWHVMLVARRLSAHPDQDYRRASDMARRALELDPGHAMALALRAYALCHLSDDVEASRQLLRQAIRHQPNEPLAWLYLGFWSTLWGSPADAVSACERALLLSPLDPQAHEFQMIAANAFLVDNQHERAIELGQKALRLHGDHPPTLRTLMTAQYELGRVEEARLSFQALMSLHPDLTVKRFLGQGSASRLRQRSARTLSALGLPYE